LKKKVSQRHSDIARAIFVLQKPFKSTLLHSDRRINMLRHASVTTTRRRSFDAVVNAARAAYTSSTNQTLSKSFSMFDAKYSDEMPLGNVAKTIGTSFGPALDAIEQEYSRRGKLQQQEQQKTTQQNGDIYVPKIPHALPISRMAKDNAFLRDVLIYDEKKKVKPRLSWYDPYDKTWVPNNWFQDGLAADMKYYFGGANTSEASDAAVNGRT